MEQQPIRCAVHCVYPLCVLFIHILSIRRLAQHHVSSVYIYFIYPLYTITIIWLLPEHSRIIVRGVCLKLCIYRCCQNNKTNNFKISSLLRMAGVLLVDVGTGPGPRDTRVRRSISVRAEGVHMMGRG